MKKNLFLTVAILLLGAFNTASATKSSIGYQIGGGMFAGLSARYKVNSKFNVNVLYSDLFKFRGYMGRVIYNVKENYAERWRAYLYAGGGILVYKNYNNDSNSNDNSGIGFVGIGGEYEFKQFPISIHLDIGHDLLDPVVGVGFHFKL